MSAGTDSFAGVSERWGREQVLGLAPDASSGKVAAKVAQPATWGGAGCDEQAVWGECQGSGSSLYRTGVDLSEPAFRCSCPSRKFPCKHALGLLLLWSDGVVAAGARPGWVREWLAQRQDKAQQVQERRETGAGAVRAKDPKTAERRERRVEDGIDELDRWLCDQVAHGLAQAERAGWSTRRPGHWRARSSHWPRFPATVAAGPAGRSGCWRSTRCCGCSPGHTGGRPTCPSRSGRPYGPGSASR
jgi:hypothetical protein